MSAYPAVHTFSKKGSFMISKRLKCLNVQESGSAFSAFSQGCPFHSGFYLRKSLSGVRISNRHTSFMI